MRAHRRVVGIAFGLALIGCKGGQAGPGGGGGGPGGPGGGMPPAEVGVVVMKAEKVTLTTELPGRTSPFLIAEVRPEVGGIILKRNFTEGGEVAAGDVLYEIDPTTYQAAVDSAQAQLERALAGASNVGVRARRYDVLAGQNAVSLQEKDDASGAVRMARADIAVAKAALAQAQIALERCKVKAPIAGRIGRSRVTVGALVAPFQPEALATIQQLDPIYVDVTRSSVEGLKLKRALASGRLAAGASENNVSLVLEDGSAYPHPGKLAFSDVTVDATTGSVTLRAEFPNPEGDLLPGMYVRALVAEGVAENAMLVPQQGVSRDPKGQAIAMVVGADGKVAPHVLEVERTIGAQWLVTKGLAVGDQVIVEGTQKAMPGAPDKAVPASFAPGGAAPGGEPPRGDAPKGDAPNGDAPKGDAPKGDAPKGDAPKGDAPKGDAPKPDGAK